MNTYHAACWSDDSYSSSSDEEDSRYRTTHHQRTKQRGRMDSWTWEEIFDGKGPWAQPGEYRRPKEELEEAKAERRRYEEELAQGKVHERQTQNFFEPTPRAYRVECCIGQAPCYAVERTVSPVHIHSLVRYIHSSSNRPG